MEVIDLTSLPFYDNYNINEEKGEFLWRFLIGAYEESFSFLLKFGLMAPAAIMAKEAQRQYVIIR